MIAKCFKCEDKKKLIYLLCKESDGAPSIAKHINDVLEENFMSAKSSQQWINKFKNGDFYSSR